MDSLSTSLVVAASGLKAESKRLRVSAENLANAHSTASTPGGDPYQRKILSFAALVNPDSNASSVEVARIGTDPTPFPIEHDPGNPGADASGNVKLPNVNALIELADMREANRSYEANLQVVKQTRELIGMTIDLLRSG